MSIFLQNYVQLLQGARVKTAGAGQSPAAFTVMQNGGFAVAGELSPDRHRRHHHRADGGLQHHDRGDAVGRAQRACEQS